MDRIDEYRMGRTSRGTSRFHAVILLGIIALTSACGNFVFPDQEGIQALRASGRKSLSLEGRVADQDGQPLAGITVVISGVYYEETSTGNSRVLHPLDTLATDTEGSYKMAQRSVVPAFTDLQVNASDSNGIFAPDSVLVRDIKVGATAPTIYLKKR